MKLSEMQKLPKKAGIARLQFISRVPTKTLNHPYRIQDRIVLPKEPKAEFYPLQNRRQFLFRSPFRNQTWFGGTDENPFLVELNNEAFEAFKRRGQKGFYQALKPKVITAVEKRFNVASKRQGDIWAVPVPSWAWDDVNFAILLCCGERAKLRTVKSASIFGTRHRLTGRCDFADLAMWGYGHYICMLATGTVKAPNHSPMKLKGFHVLAQTRHLNDHARVD